MIYLYGNCLLAFRAVTFFTDMVQGILFGVCSLVAIFLMAEDRSREKRGEYLMAAVISAVIYWLLWMAWGSLLSGAWVLFGVPWVCYKWLDFSLVRSLVALVVLLVADWLIRLLLAYLLL